MCDVCNSEGLDWKFKNGPDSNLTLAKLFRVYVGQTASIKVCKIHAIELFRTGENRFLREHIPLVSTLSVKKQDSFF